MHQFSDSKLGHHLFYGLDEKKVKKRDILEACWMNVGLLDAFWMDVLHDLQILHVFPGWEIFRVNVGKYSIHGVDAFWMGVGWLDER